MAPVDQFIAAITQQETGGEANPYASRWGKYAINPAYVNSMAMQYLGRPMTAAQYLSSPANQDLLGRAALTKLYNQYGAEGAASSWYSGSPNNAKSTKAQPGGPSIAGYVQSVLGRMGNVTVDLTKQPADSPLSPYQAQQSPVVRPMAAATGVGLGAASGLDAADAGVGLGAADGTDPTPTMSQPVLTAGALPAMAGTGGPGQTTGLMSGGPATGLRAAAIGIGKQYLGVPYVWGGTSPNGLDCSGLVQKILQGVGISAPRVSYAQLSMGPRIDPGSAQPGDLIGWGDGHHVAMYIGNGQILEAPRTGLNVRIRSLGDSWDRNQGYFAVSMSNYYKG